MSAAVVERMSHEELFATLTRAQHAVLDAGGWRIGSGKRPLKRSVERLLALGLIVERPRRFMRLVIGEWFVPDDVAEAWALWKAAALAAETRPQS